MSSSMMIVAAAQKTSGSCCRTTSGCCRKLVNQHRIQRSRTISTTVSLHKSASVVQATNMPLNDNNSACSNHHMFLFSAPQQQHQQSQPLQPPKMTTTMRQPSQRLFQWQTPSSPTTPTTSRSTLGKRMSVLAASSSSTAAEEQQRHRSMAAGSGDASSPTSSSFSSEEAAAAFETRIMDQLLVNHTDGGGDELFDMDELSRLASLAPTPLRLGDMYKYANNADRSQRLRNAQFLHRELPIRLAQRAYDLLSLPHGLSSESTPIRKVALVYIHYIQQFRAFPVPTTDEEEDAFTELLHGMVMDRTSIPSMVARGLAEWLGDGKREDWELERQQEMEDALVRFFTARVGLRFLTEHHILSSPSTVQRQQQLRQTQTQCPLPPSSEKDRGCIQHDCNPVLECESVAREVARQTYDCYGMCPEIEIVDRQSTTAQVFTYVPHHLHYMLAELLKNSCRASVERYMELGGNKSPTARIPPVRVVIVKGANEVTIKVSDQGGGIPRSTMSRIFKFTHSTSRQDYEKDTDFGTVEAGIQHMRGFGLPLARIYARYFGGELTLKSMEGYGLDAYLYLPRLGDACENLPPRVSSSPGELVSLPSARRKKNQNSTTTTPGTSSSSTSSSPSSPSSGGSSARTYSTMIPKLIREVTEAMSNPLKASPLQPSTSTSRTLSSAPDDAPRLPSRVMDPYDVLVQSSCEEWQEAKVRRVLQILRMRAL